jgi:hypothetical protein
MALAPLLSLMLMAAWPVRAAGAITAVEQENWLWWASGGLVPPAVEALALIEKPERRLLAARSYLRAGESLAGRWTWSQERISAYPSTPEGKAAAVDIDAVLSAFAASNPGYTLHVNREARSLELQIQR